LATSVTGAEYFIRLRAGGQANLESPRARTRPAIARLWRARTSAQRASPELLSIHVHLAGLLSVDYIDIKGKDLLTGKLIEERVRHQAQEP